MPYYLSSFFYIQVISGMALNSLQFTKCYFSTRKRFQTPLLMIYIDPVTKVKRLALPNSAAIVGERVTIHDNLMMKLVHITI